MQSANNDHLEFYSSLGGSSGQVSVSLSKAFLEKICALLESQFMGALEQLLVAPCGNDRFRIWARLPNIVATWFGSSFLNILSDEGIEIEIEQPCAYPNKPLQGSLVTTLFGKTIIPQLVKFINLGLGAGKPLTMSSELLRPTTHITLDPFPLLRKFLPFGMGVHITRVEFRASHGSIDFTFDWHHSGSRRQTVPSTSRGKPMDQQMQKFVDNLVNSQFAEMKGSCANLHLELPEKLLNEAAKALTADKGPNANRWLALVQSIKVKAQLASISN
jgi:hypothetical protein